MGVVIAGAIFNLATDSLIASSTRDINKGVVLENYEPLARFNKQDLPFIASTAPLEKKGLDIELVEFTPYVEPEPEPQPAPAQKNNNLLARSYQRNNGTWITGNEIVAWIRSNPAGEQLYQAFSVHGEEVAIKSAITLYYENGTVRADTVGVCSSIHQIGGDYRNCAYADMNTAGMDAGLIQVNTFYQRYRIAKLGGPACEPIASRDRQDICTALQVQWLQNPENNIKIALDIYSESGFAPWYGAKKAGII